MSQKQIPNKRYFKKTGENMGMLIACLSDSNAAYFTLIFAAMAALSATLLFMPSSFI